MLLKDNVFYVCKVIVEFPTITQKKCVIMENSLISGKVFDFTH